MNPKPQIVKSAARVLEILEFVANNNTRRPTFTEILNHLNIPKSSLSNLLQELLQQDYIKFETSTKTYSPGLKLVRLSAVCLNSSNVLEEIWLGIKSLSDETRETTHAAVLSGRYATYISKVQGREELGLLTNTGLRLPAHATAMGKMLLSALPDCKFYDLMNNVHLERLTANTIVDTEQLHQELAKIARQGYATEQQESTIGACCVSAPIYDKTNKMIASISITFSASRATSERFKEYIEKTTHTGKIISRMLGYSWTN